MHGAVTSRCAVPMPTPLGAGAACTCSTSGLQRKPVVDLLRMPDFNGGPATGMPPPVPAQMFTQCRHAMHTLNPALP